MKKCVMVSFDLIRDGEVEQSLSTASIMSCLRRSKGYGEVFQVEHISLNMLLLPSDVIAYFEGHFRRVDFASINTLAIPSYIWNEYLLSPFIKFVRINGFRGKVVLGGYQISYSDSQQLASDYPFADIFISGYGESSMLTAIESPIVKEKAFLNQQISFGELPSPYLTGDITVANGQSMLRFETKRGCPYRCTFCAHRDLSTNKVHRHPLEKVFEEIAFFKEKDVKRINILDPIFNVGKDYLTILKEMVRVGLQAEITLQTRFEQIVGDAGQEFISLCEQLNITLEFGLQTVVEKEYSVINRRNDPKKVKAAMEFVNSSGIKHEISLIYGLPHQTPDSFRSSIEFAREMGAKDIKAWPLMLLKGTELHDEKQKWGMREKVVGEFDIPLVVESNSFTESQWWEMREIAESLLPSNRI
jgi:radical SAM superfamily enzyme YgiQ (UPF0313 family)